MREYTILIAVPDNWTDDFTRTEMERVLDYGFEDDVILLEVEEQ